MQKLEQIYEGKAKKVFKTDDPELLIVDYKDDATAFNGLKKGTILGKGVINNQMSNRLMAYLEKQGVPTHFIEEINERETVVKKVSIVPLEVIVRNVAAGSFSKKYGVPEGTALNNRVVEFSLKSDELGDPMINDSQITAIGVATQAELDELRAMLFAKCGIRLVDFKLEFGRAGGELLLCDEISPDSCRLWDAETNRKMDKDRFRRDLGDVLGGYRDVLARLQSSI